MSHLDGLGFLNVASMLDTVSPALQEGVSTAAGGALQTALTGGNSEAYLNALRAGGTAAIDAALPPTMAPVASGPGINALPIAGGAQQMPIVSPNGIPVSAGGGGKTMLTIGLVAAVGVGAWWFMKRRKKRASAA